MELRACLELLSEGEKGSLGSVKSLELCLLGCAYQGLFITELPSEMTRLAVLVCASVSGCAESHRQTERCEMAAKQVSWSNWGASYHKVREKGRCSLLRAVLAPLWVVYDFIFRVF